MRLDCSIRLSVPWVPHSLLYVCMCRQDDFLLSGTVVGSPAGSNTSVRVWRFTPADPTSFQPNISPASSRFTTRPANVTLPVQIHLYGKLRTCELELEQATLRSSETSHFGWWIMQPDSAPLVVVNCSDGHDTGLMTTWPLPAETIGS